jgi:hypothetical protein
MKESVQNQDKQHTNDAVGCDEKSSKRSPRSSRHPIPIKSSEAFAAASIPSHSFITLYCEIHQSSTKQFSQVSRNKEKDTVQ